MIPTYKTFECLQSLCSSEIAAILHITVIHKRYPNIGANSVFANFLGPNVSATMQLNYFILVLSLRHLPYS